uniref:RRM domain-containing protein n=1 Tax=Anolis carolinensis TaxID=28377 RepID=A0A803TYP4_ANOCA
IRSVRLFVRGFPRGSTQRDMRRHFEKAVGPGDVLDVSVRGLCAIVRMRDEAAGERARRELHGQPFLGIPISVHRFRGIKIYVGGLPEYCAPEDLRPLFQEYGPVAECGVVKGVVPSLSPSKLFLSSRSPAVLSSTDDLQLVAGPMFPAWE